MRYTTRWCALVMVVLFGYSADGALTHRYSFEGDANDSVGSADGVLYNTLGTAYFDSGQLYLENSDLNRSHENLGNYVTLPSGLISDNGNQASFEAWLTWDGGKVWQSIFDFGTGSDGNVPAHHFFATPYTGAMSRAGCNDVAAGQSVERWIESPPLTFGTPQHVAVVWDGDADAISYYLNGTRVAMGDASQLDLATLQDSNNWLGRAQTNEPMLRGAFDEFRIYNEALSPAQVAMNAKMGADVYQVVTAPSSEWSAVGPIHRYSFDGDTNDSIGDAHGKLVQGTGHAMFADGQLQLGNDGTQCSAGNCGDYVDLPNGLISALGQNATFEIWSTWNGDSDWQRILDFGISDGGEDVSGGAAGAAYLMATPQAWSGRLASAYRDGGEGSIEQVVDDMGPMKRGEQQHLAIVWDGEDDTVALYVDGILQNVAETHFELSDIVDDNNWLGRAQWNDPMFVGSYDEFRIYDYALNASEVLGSYNTGPDRLNSSPKSETLHTVPEPGSLGLLVAGLLGLALGWRRRRRTETRQG